LGFVVALFAAFVPHHATLTDTFGVRDLGADFGADLFPGEGLKNGRGDRERDVEAMTGGAGLGL